MKINKELAEIAKVFFKLGFIAFGGPAAHIAMMEKEVVEKRKWMTQQHFLDLVGATNLIPGPNSTEMTMHCGHERAGWKGLFLAGISFIFPAVVLTGLLAWLYVKYGSIPAVEPFLYGIKPAVIAIIIGAVIKLGKKALKSWQLGVIGGLVIVASLLGLNEIIAILASGVVGIVWFGLKDKLSKLKIRTFFPLVLLASGSSAINSVSGLKLFLIFLKIGSVLFGSGYVLIAYLDGELVEKLHWLTEQQLLDAIAMGQFTPGPVLSTATFIGYQVSGFSGAVIATAGIFLPSFLFVLILNPIVPKLRRSALASGFLDAVNIGAVGIMVAVTFNLGQDMLVDWRTATIATASTILIFIRPKNGAMWLVIGGAAVGYVFTLI